MRTSRKRRHPGTRQVSPARRQKHRGPEMSAQSTLSGSAPSAGGAAPDLCGDGGETNEGAGDDVSQLDSANSDGPSSIPAYSREETSHADDASSKYILERLRDLYRKHVLKAEERYHLHYNFGLPTDGELKESEFDPTPMVLLIGQYSTGKTTFLNHLLGEDFPGMHIGPEPTTDKFMALYHGGDHADASDDKTLESEDPPTRDAADGEDASRSAGTDYIRSSGRLVKGNTLTITPSLPFASLSQYGSAFLNHFVGSSCNSPLLKRLMFIDSPGILSGQKQRVSRPYDFRQVTKWFADRSHLILLLFDAHKLDISDELQGVIDTIRVHNDDKIRCVLNKADCVTREQLVRVYGALMYSMGKIFNTPEVVRVYTGSYWNGPLTHDDFREMFEEDERLLVQELLDLPRCAAERKMNQMVHRIRMVKVHVCILGTIRGMTPLWFGKERSRERILNNLALIMRQVRAKFELSEGDMPDPESFAKCLEAFPDFSVFPSVDRALIRRLDLLIAKEIPAIVRDAEIVAEKARLGERGAGGVKGVLRQFAAKQDPSDDGKSENARTILGLLAKIFVFIFLLACVAEGVHYLAYSRPAYSPLELRDGLANYATSGSSKGPPPAAGDEL